MDRFISSLFVTFAFLSMAASQQLPCDSPLRRFAVLADYFAHCECRYGNWTDVVPYANATLIAVPPSQCSSGFAILGERRQEATTEQCQNKTEESYVCSRSYACQYGNWSDGVVRSVNATVVGVPRNQCRSGFARQGQRWQTPISGYGCEDKIEEIYMYTCMGKKLIFLCIFIILHVYTCI